MPAPGFAGTELQAHSTHPHVLEHAQVVRDGSRRLSLAEARARPGRTRQSASDAADSNGNVPGPVWAYLPVTNNTDAPMRWRLDYRDPYGTPVNAYLVTGDGAPVRILANDWVGQSYRDRFPRTRLPASRPFSVAPGQTVELWFDATYGFPVRSALWLTPEERFFAQRLRETGYSAFVFGIRVALLFAVLTFAIILNEKVAYYYCLYHAALLAFFAQNYGFVYAYVLKNQALDNAWFIIAGALAFTFFGLMTRAFLSAPARYPRYDRVLIASLIGGWIAGALNMLVGSYAGLILLMIGVVSFVLTFAYGAYLGLRDRLYGSQLFFIATLFVFASNFFGLLSWWPLELIPEHTIVDVTHLAFAIDAVLFGAALVVRAVCLRRERDEATAAEMVALAAKADLTERLADARKAHARAVNLAEGHRRDLAMTSHDLKQPLLSLQMALKGRDDVEAISHGLSYLESIVSRNLEETRPADEAAAVHGKTKGQEILKLSRALGNAALMFEEEAAAKGLTLKAVPTSLAVSCEPVVLMRVLINLVANAVKHTASGRIVIGARRRGEKVSVEVLDSGPGLTAKEIKAAFRPYAKGDRSAGEGLGLAVVKDLAKKHGWDLQVTSTPGVGSRFAISGLQRA